MLTDEAVLVLQQFAFPGNVRELEHLMDRAAVQSGSRAITGEVIRRALPSMAEPQGEGPLENLLQLPFHESVAGWEKRRIEHALLQANGNKSDAARRLGIHRRLLYEKMLQLDLH